MFYGEKKVATLKTPELLNKPWPKNWKKAIGIFQRCPPRVRSLGAPTDEPTAAPPIDSSGSAPVRLRRFRRPLFFGFDSGASIVKMFAFGHWIRQKEGLSPKKKDPPFSGGPGFSQIGADERI